jgi:hypothetical protein
MLLTTPLLPLNTPQMTRLVKIQRLTGIVTDYEPRYQTDKGSGQSKREHRNRYGE